MLLKHNGGVMEVKYIKYLAMLFSAVTVLLVACRRETFDYGVFTGDAMNQRKKYERYDSVVVEPSNFTSRQVESLKEDGRHVYAYLNIGSLENSQPYCKRYEDVMLDRYDGWPDEHWVDVTREKWQRLVVQERARVYKERGFDGLFIDNADVYHRYHTPEVYQSLKSMLASLKRQGFKLIVNGGDVFISETLKDGSARRLYDGINQEDVFTTYHFDKKEYGRQSREDTAYYEGYLKKARKAGLDVYIVEYRAGRELSRKIDAYCERHGYKWYNADSIKLN